MALSTFPVADVLLKIAEQEGVNLSVEGVDDICYGLVISSDKTFLSFLQEHALPYNWLIVDGDPIRVVRRAVNDSLVMDHTITQADCVPSGGAAVSFKRTDEGNLPREIEIQYTDPDRQYATTTRSGRHLGAPFENPGRSISIDFLISATQAREMAFDTLYRIWSQQLTVSFEHRDITIEPGDTILLSCDQGTYTLLVTEAIYTASRTTQVSATVLLASSGITIPAGDWANWPPAPVGSPDAATSPDFVPPPSSPHIGLALQISTSFTGSGTLTANGSIDAPAIQGLSANFVGSGSLIANRGSLIFQDLESVSGTGIIQVRLGVKPAFVPSDLGTLVGWWDATDSGTLTDAGSGHCSQWNDKSSNANNVVQATDGSRPIITASGINGLTTLTFSTQVLEKLTCAGLPSLATGIGFGVVMKAVNASVGSLFDISDNTSTNRTALVAFAPMTLRSQNANASTKAFSDTTTAHIISGTISTVLRDVYIDGAQGTSNNTTQTSLASTNIRFGELFTGANILSGQIGEIVWFSGASATSRQSVEGYLAWKWGLQATLPASHPYVA